MEHIDTVVIGAGHAGLAMSKLLTEHGIGHTVNETVPIVQTGLFVAKPKLRGVGRLIR